MKQPLTLDTLASGLALSLVAAIGLVILLGGQLGVRITTDLPDGHLVSPYQTITLTFSEPVDPKLAEALWTLQPQVDGRIDWPNPRTLRFTPTHPLNLDTDYELTLHPGTVSADGLQVRWARHWKMQVRDPLIVVIRSSEDDSALWAVNMNGKDVYRITRENLKVIDYDVARSGDYLVYSSTNEKGGVNLWRVSRQGGDDQILLDCVADYCTLPTISSDGTRIAYTREAAGAGPNLPYGAPRIWMIDLSSGQNGPLYEDQQIIGYGSSWSPDGTRLASFDALNDQIRVLDLPSSKQFVFSSAIGAPIAWSPDSSVFLFTDVKQGENGLLTQVRRADLTINKTDTLIGDKDQRDYSYGALAWSPVGDRVVLSLRTVVEAPGETLWLFDPVLLEGPSLVSKEETTYNAPFWNPWGTGLVIQQFRLRGEYVSEISLWMQGDSEPHTLTQGLMARWLP